MATRALFLFICVHSWPLSAETLDRIAVTVDKRVITESDVTRDLRVAAFSDGKPLDLSPDSKRKAAERLVDQILILQEAADSRVTLSTPEDVPRVIEAAKMPYGGDAEYRAALARYHITEADLAAHLLDHLRALRFTDLRFHRVVEVSEKDLRDLYEKYAADWRKSKSAPVPGFEESRQELEDLITGERAMQALDDWLEITRAQKHVEYREEVFK